MSSIFRDTWVEAGGTFLEDHTPTGGVGGVFTWVNEAGAGSELKFYNNHLHSYGSLFQNHYSLSEDITGDHTVGIVVHIGPKAAQGNFGADIELAVLYDPADDSSYRFEIFDAGSYIAWILYNWDSSYSRDGRLSTDAYDTDVLIQLRVVGGVAYGLINGAVVACMKADTSEAPSGTGVKIHTHNLCLPSSLGGPGLGSSYILGPFIIDQPQTGEEQYCVPIYSDNFNTGFDSGEELSLHAPTIGANGGATHEEFDTFAWEKGLEFLTNRADLHTGNLGASHDGLHGTTDPATGSHYQANGSTHPDDHIVSMTCTMPASPQSGSLYGVATRVPTAVTGSEPLNGWTLTLDDTGLLLMQHWVAGSVVASASVALSDGVTALTRTDYEDFAYTFDLKMPHTLSLFMYGDEVLGMLDGLAVETLVLTGATETGGLPGLLGVMLESSGGDPADRLYTTFFGVTNLPEGAFIPPSAAIPAGDGGGSGANDFAPYELYHFVQGPNEWNYTTREGPVTMDGIDYTPMEIQRTNFTFGSDRGDAGIEVTLPRNCPLLTSMYDGTTPGSVALFIYVPSRANFLQVVPIFIGKVSGLASEKGVGKISVRRIQDEEEEVIPRKAIQLTCPNMLYDVNCRAVIDDFLFHLTIDSIDGRTYVVSGSGTDHIEPGSNYYQNGFIQLGMYRAFVEFQDGTTIRTMSPLATAIVGSVIDAVAGCDRTTTMCNDKFDNIENFLGFPMIPGRNPWVVGLR